MSLLLLKMMAIMMPVEAHIERLQGELLTYKIAPSKEGKGKLMTELMLLITALQDEDKSVEEVVKSAVEGESKLNAMKNMFDTGNSN